MTVTSTSKAWRWYQYWVKLGGMERKPENLCRFIRVLLFWGPLRWFFVQGHRRESPLGICLISAFIGTILFFLGYAVYQDWRLVAVITLAVVDVILGAIVVCTGIGYMRKASFLREYINEYREARASKYCPFIEVKDE